MYGKTFDEVVTAIKKKKNTEYCGIYELMYHDTIKKDCFKKGTLEEQRKVNPEFRKYELYKICEESKEEEVI